MGRAFVVLHWLFLFIASGALFGVYISVILDKIWLSWFFFAIAFLPAFFWFLRSRRKFTPFVMPLIFSFGGGLWGVLVSDSHLSVGIFQTLLASILTYFIVVHFPYKRRLLILIYVSMGIIAMLFVVFGLGQESSLSALKGNSYPFVKELVPEKVPLITLPEWFLTPRSPTLLSHGLILLMLILFLITVCLIFFVEKRKKFCLGISGFFLLLLISVLGGNSFLRLFKAKSLFGRAGLWSEIGNKVKDIPLSGLGLGELIDKYGIVNPHNAYLQLWSELGILGIVSAILAFIIFIWLSGRILSSPSKSPWFGFSLGIIFSILLCIIVGVVETSPFACAVPGKEPWHLVILPLLPILAGTLESLHGILERERSLENLI